MRYVLAPLLFVILLLVLWRHVLTPMLEGIGVGLGV